MTKSIILTINIIEIQEKNIKRIKEPIEDTFPCRCQIRYPSPFNSLWNMRNPQCRWRITTPKQRSLFLEIVEVEITLSLGKRDLREKRRRSEMAGCPNQTGLTSFYTLQIRNFGCVMHPWMRDASKYCRVMKSPPLIYFSMCGASSANSSFCGRGKLVWKLLWMRDASLDAWRIQ